MTKFCKCITNRFGIKNGYKYINSQHNLSSHRYSTLKLRKILIKFRYVLIRFSYVRPSVKRFLKCSMLFFAFDWQHCLAVYEKNI